MNLSQGERRLRVWANAKALPLQCLQKWLALKEPGRTQLLELAENLRMRTGQFVAALALLEEIAIREGREVGEILASPSLGRVYNSEDSGPGRARALLDELRSLRYPQLKHMLQRLGEEVAAIRLPRGIKIVFPHDLSSDEVRVELTAHGRVEMQQLLAALNSKTRELVRLAGIIGGADDAFESK